MKRTPLQKAAYEAATDIQRAWKTLIDFNVAEPGQKRCIIYARIALTGCLRTLAPIMCEGDLEDITNGRRRG